MGSYNVVRYTCIRYSMQAHRNALRVLFPFLTQATHGHIAFPWKACDPKALFQQFRIPTDGQTSRQTDRRRDRKEGIRKSQLNIQFLTFHFFTPATGIKITRKFYRFIKLYLYTWSKRSNIINEHGIDVFHLHHIIIHRYFISWIWFLTISKTNISIDLKTLSILKYDS